MSNVTKEAKTSGTEQKKIGFISVQKKEARHKLNVSDFDHFIEISISKTNK